MKKFSSLSKREKLSGYWTNTGEMGIFSIFHIVMFQIEEKYKARGSSHLKRMLFENYNLKSHEFCMYMQMYHVDLL